VTLVLEQKTWINVIYSKKTIEHSKYRSKARDQVNKRPIKIVHAKTSVTDWTRFQDPLKRGEKIMPSPNKKRTLQK
jgi:hypothetical protein